MGDVSPIEVASRNVDTNTYIWQVAKQLSTNFIHKVLVNSRLYKAKDIFNAKYQSHKQCVCFIYTPNLLQDSLSVKEHLDVIDQARQLTSDWIRVADINISSLLWFTNTKWQLVSSGLWHLNALILSTV